jgi:hypothetical protein
MYNTQSLRVPTKIICRKGNSGNNSHNFVLFLKILRDHIQYFIENTILKCTPSPYDVSTINIKLQMHG